MPDSEYKYAYSPSNAASAIANADEGTSVKSTYLTRNDETGQLQSSDGREFNTIAPKWTVYARKGVGTTGVGVGNLNNLGVHYSNAGESYWRGQDPNGYGRLGDMAATAIGVPLLGITAGPAVGNLLGAAAPYAGQAINWGLNGLSRLGQYQSAWAAAHPYANLGLTSYFAGSSLNNMLGSNGTQKTINLANQTYNNFKNGNFDWKGVGNTAKSFAGDLFDASVVAGPFALPVGQVYSKGKELYDAAKDFTVRNYNAYKNMGSNSYKAVGAITADVTKKNPLRLKNYEYLFDPRFQSDVTRWPIDVKAERLAGEYPLTYPERSKWITQTKQDIKDGIRFSRNEALENPEIYDVELVKKMQKGLSDVNEELRTMNLEDEHVLEKVALKTNLQDELERRYRNKEVLDDALSIGHFGTLNARVHYGEKNSNSDWLWPNEGDYGAYEIDGIGTYFPFRSAPNTLRINDMLIGLKNRIGIGAHEYEHTVLSLHRTPLTIYSPKTEGEYGDYTNTSLPSDLYDAGENIVLSAGYGFGTAGKWQGSISEMDSELKNWRALENLPKYSEMTPTLKLLIIDKANKRFWLYSDFSLGRAKSSFQNHLNAPSIPNDVRTLDVGLFGRLLRPTAPTRQYNYNSLDDYINSTLPYLRFNKFFEELEKAGYKNGGKINYMNYAK